MGVAHLNILFGNYDQNRIAPFMVTVTKICDLGLLSIFISQNVSLIENNA